MIRVDACVVTNGVLRLDYQLKNAFTREIWVGDAFGNKGVPYGVGAETRISGETLHIDFRFDLPAHAHPYVAMSTGYLHLRPGESQSRTLLLQLPLVDNSFERLSTGVPAEYEEDAVVHRIVFEIGYFEEDLSAALKASLEADGGKRRSDDPDIVFVPYYWQGFDREKSTQVVIEDVNVPVRVLTR